MNLTVLEWAKREFTPASRPRQNVIWRWIREGKVPATKLGKRYFIPASFKLNGQTGDPLADKILESGYGTTAHSQQRAP